MRAIGIVGWSGAGKTTLITSLIPELNRRGLSSGSARGMRVKVISWTEGPVEDELHVHMCSRALERPMDEGGAFRPQRQVGRKLEQRPPGRVLKRHDPTRSNPSAE